MSKELESYHDHVEAIETGLSPCSKRSFEPFSPRFLDGGDILKHFTDIWKKTSRKLVNRTPLQLERDRILYSSGMRKQTEKYHVLYNGQRRIVRNYITHTMRTAQVTRSICRGLKLNADFAEAIAIGSKIGAVPFVHAAKSAIADWVRKQILKIDEQYSKNHPIRAEARQQLSLEFGDSALPSWIASLRSEVVFNKVRAYIPWAAGNNVDSAYSAGQESYWLLSTNPFTVEANTSAYVPETMFGIWRHTRGLRPEAKSFHHRMQLIGPSRGYQEITWKDATYEAIIVQYADDITWVIENLNDANSAALLNQRRGIYEPLQAELGADIPDGLLRALSRNDAGGLYTYFIADFDEYSKQQLQRLSDGAQCRIALREGKDENLVGLSPEAENQLGKMVKFLNEQVFTEARVKNRTQMLRTVSEACIELLYGGAEDVLPKFISEKAALDRWSPEKINKARELIDDPIHRIQVAVDILADMGDQEIYDFVGIQSL